MKVVIGIRSNPNCIEIASVEDAKRLFREGRIGSDIHAKAIEWLKKPAQLPTILFSERLKTMSEEIQLGDIARDKITGFEGVVIANTQWLNGCDRLTLKPRKLKKGVSLQSEAFDRPQLELVERQVLKATRKTGGPQPMQSRHSDPKGG